MQLPDPKSQKFKNMIIAALLLLIAGSVYWAFGPKTARGQAAFAAMHDGQKQIATKLLALKPGASVADVSAILGKPMENLDVRVKWKGPVNRDLTRIIGTFPGGKLQKLTYMSRGLDWSWTIESDGKRMVVAKDAK